MTKSELAQLVYDMRQAQRQARDGERAYPEMLERKVDHEVETILDQPMLFSETE